MAYINHQKKNPVFFICFLVLEILDYLRNQVFLIFQIFQELQRSFEIAGQIFSEKNLLEFVKT